MDKNQERKIFDAVKKDDLKMFSSILISHSDLNLCYGRFPLLSLMYLYGSYKILDRYEKFMLGIKNYKVTDEYFEIYKKFKKHAKKCLKLYVEKDKFVDPIEMLAILDERLILKQNYSKLYKNEEIVKNLKLIYNLKENSDVEISMNEFDCKKKKLNVKQKIFNSIILIFLCICLIFSGTSIGVIGFKTGIGTAGSPIIIRNEQEFISALKNGKKNYLLKNDMTLSSKEISGLYNFSGTLDGGGHKVVFEDEINNSLFKKLTGKLKNLNFEIAYSNFEINNNYAIIAEYSSGIIENCEISGTFVGKTLETENDVSSEEVEDVFVSLFAVENAGVILNCLANVSVNVVNVNETNVYFSAFAGTNNGEIKYSKNSSEKEYQIQIETDTVDVAGIVAINNGKIYGCENFANISQVSSKAWHPNTAGIAMTNNGNIEASKNYGEIKSESKLALDDLTDEQKIQFENNDLFFYVFAGGIVADNFGVIDNSRNFGEITGLSVISTVYAGGISAMNEKSDKDKSLSPQILKSKSECEVFVLSTEGDVYAGGVSAYNANILNNCAFIGKIVTNSTTAAYAGGVCAANFWGISQVHDSYAKVSFKSESNDDVLTVFGQIYSFIQISTRSYIAFIPNYFSNNYFVNDESKDYPAGNVWIVFESMIAYLQDDFDGCTECKKLSDIDESLILKD